ncbi:hypothetical protein [Sorangium sp. So ce854]|uniref:hypothetical protein n=1 Tax=Sorangium sp. So ce854 TaxID=3133322 RepID=UPI003F6020A0
MRHIPTAPRRLVHERAGGACEYCLFPEWMAATVRLLQLNHPNRLAERALLIEAGLIPVPAGQHGAT